MGFAAGSVVAPEAGAALVGPGGNEPNEALTLTGAPEVVAEIWSRIGGLFDS